MYDFKDTFKESLVISNNILLSTNFNKNVL